MSTLVLPGLGQCIMKRWAIGLFYALGFLISALLFLITLVVPLVKNMMMLTDMSSPNGITEVPWPRALFGLACTVLIYMLNTTDIILRTRGAPRER